MYFMSYLSSLSISPQIPSPCKVGVSSRPFSSQIICPGSIYHQHGGMERFGKETSGRGLKYFVSERAGDNFGLNSNISSNKSISVELSLKLK